MADEDEEVSSLPRLPVPLVRGIDDDGVVALKLSLSGCCMAAGVSLLLTELLLGVFWTKMVRCGFGAGPAVGAAASLAIVVVVVVGDLRVSIWVL